MMTLRLCRALLIGLAGLLFASLQALAADKLNVGIDWFLNPNHGPLVVALERGFFAEAGLDVTLVAPETTVDNVTMVLDGRVDIGMSDQVRTQVEVAGGSPLQIIGTLIPVPLNIILALDGGPVKTIGDLRGKRIGYADSEKTERGLLEIALATKGIAISDVTLVDVEFSMVKALLDGKVDALTDAYRNFEPIQVTLAGKKPRIFNLEDETIPPYSELVYIAKRQAVDADKIERFLTAVERGARFIARTQRPAGSCSSNTTPSSTPSSTSALGPRPCPCSPCVPRRLMPCATNASPSF